MDVGIVLLITSLVLFAIALIILQIDTIDRIRNIYKNEDDKHE